MLDSSEEEDESSEAEAENAKSHEADEEDEPDDDSTASEGEELARRRRTDQFVRSLQQVDGRLMADPPTRVSPLPRRARSQGAISEISHLSEPLKGISNFFSNSQNPIQIDDNDDEKLQIIPRPPANAFPQPRPRSRSKAARRSTSGLFCTPGPDERISVARTNETTTASPSATASVYNRASSAHIDLTLDDDSDEDLLNDTPSRQAGPSPSPSGQQQQVARQLTDPPQSSPRQEISYARVEGEAEKLERAAGLFDLGGDGRVGSSSPQPRGVKRTRDGSSVAASEPGEGGKKRPKIFDFGSHTH